MLLLLKYISLVINVICLLLFWKHLGKIVDFLFCLVFNEMGLLKKKKRIINRVGGNVAYVEMNRNTSTKDCIFLTTLIRKKKKKVNNTTHSIFLTT